MEQNKMGAWPVGKLLINMSVPMILSMLTQALYNIVDSIFVARISEYALTAVSLSFPIFNMMIALGVGTGIGVNALVSRNLGAGDREKANAIATHGIWLAIITGIVFMALTLSISGLYFDMLADDEVIKGHGLAYIRIIGGFSIGLFFQTMIEKLLQSTGNTFLAMVIQIFGAVINIILDPIMIFGLLGMPKMGVAGAAIATIIGQCSAAVLGLIINKTKNTEISVSLSKYKLNGSLVKEIYKIGVPSIVLGSVGSVMNFGLNKILIGFSSTASAVFGVYFRLQSFVFMPVIGLNNGMVPIIAFNYGAKNPERIMKTLKYSYIAAISFMVLGCLTFQIFPGPLLRLFDASDNMMEMGVKAFKIISIHFLTAGFSITSSSLFQALGRATIGMCQSILRQLVVLLPVAFVLAKIGGLDMVWWSFVISEAVAALYTLYYLIKIKREVINPLK